jgi:hypothetical protein
LTGANPNRAEHIEAAMRLLRAWLLLLASASALAQTGEYRTLATALEDDYFDGRTPQEYARVSRHLRAARQLGAKYFRCAFSWNGIEPQQGKFKWRFWDHVVREAERNHIQLIPYIAYTPEWAARTAKEFWRQPPKAPQLYADVLRAVVSRYRGRVYSWEIWNEPDLAEYWTGTADEFAELVRIAAPVIRAADPQAKVVLGGLSHGPGEFYRLLHDKYQIEQYVDVVAMHAYPESWDEERAESIYYDRVDAMAKLIAPSRRELWLNETGYPDYRLSANRASIYGVHVYYDYEHTAPYQAAFLFKSFVMALGGEQATLMGWYRTDDFPHSDKRLPDDKVHNHLGLFDTHGRPKPAVRAFAFFNRLFATPTRKAQISVTSSAGRESQAIVEARETKPNADRPAKLTVIAWLRSSEDNELHDRSGRARDLRRESLTVQLPCTETRGMKFYSPTGATVTSPARVAARNRLAKIPLRGDGIFVAMLSCIRD